MGRKITIIITLTIVFLTGGIIWLFSNNFSQLFLKQEIIINNPSPDKKIGSPKNSNKEKVLKKQPPKTKTENDISDSTAKTTLENYFFTLANINLPDSKLISDVINLHLKGEKEGLQIIIALFKEASKNIYKITPPKEAENIHKNNSWAVNKMINVLEEILNKSSNQEEFRELTKKLEMEETQKIVSQTNQEITSLIAKYDLDNSFLK